MDTEQFSKNEYCVVVHVEAFSERNICLLPNMFHFLGVFTPVAKVATLIYCVNMSLTKLLTKGHAGSPGNNFKTENETYYK